MAVCPILVYPDPILKQVAEAVGEVDEAVVAVIQDLVDTMVASGHSVGVGDGDRREAWGRRWRAELRLTPAGRSCTSSIIAAEAGAAG